MRARPPACPAGSTSKRDHGGLLFIDLRDHYGLTQMRLPAGSPAFAAADALRVESVITVTGEVVRARARHRQPAAADRRDRAAGGDARRAVAADVLPIQVAGDETYSDELRLRYRYIDLRRERVHAT